jgi:zinc/manganese transport system substrate-binding protein
MVQNTHAWKIMAPVALGLVLSACGSHDHAVEELPPPELTTAEQGRAVNVVVSTNILGDIVSQLVACAGDGDVTVLMPAGVDPHDFSPSSTQVAQIVEADVVFTNGLQLESGLDGALEGARADGARVFEVAPRIDPIEFGAGGHDHGDEAKKDDHDDDHDDHGHDDHDHGDLDPHFWFDMSRMATATTLMAQELGVVTGDEDTYTSCGADLANQITAAEVNVRAALESVPADARILITDHEALGYLANAYDYEIAGTVIPAGTTLASPSSADIADLTKVMRDEGVNVIFANVAEPTKLADAVAAELGGNVRVVPLFVESLGEPGSGADSYIGLMQTNADLIAQNLKN